MSKKKEWFGEWFDSPYYHILYKDRDNLEASTFIDNICNYLGFSKTDKILDLACGKGRHAIYLNKKGFDVTGIDLSEKNIKYASQFSNAKLSFYIHDMREVFAYNQFDYVLNAFTSFGYFDSAEEHKLAIIAAAKALKPGGALIIDFLNTYRVVNHLVPAEAKKVDGILFNITKEISDDGYIIKQIVFNHQGDEYCYREKVKAISRVEFLDFFGQAGLSCKALLGDYDLNAYRKEVSDRMIFVVEK
ncbi:class I SAM-dependent methyltransferase [Fulvivirgaceae bacterium BMA12]|uniref:Class I SAM-dependent methyltransferase n=1 Tax=Agaribacillus aureus TaxID=3051825 RepID=A0ABT8LJ21_9BACT|nr:class I SAM-dependent methyltransferase [Fulvivirgaceae bacterium BMA12]